MGQAAIIPKTFAVLLLPLLLCQRISNCHGSSNGTGTKAKEKDGKFLNIFSIVTFPNDPCSSGSRNGTCYTEGECSSRGGTNSGSCASGFGVCCVITVGCGGTSNDNCTYFDSNSPVAGTCKIDVCPCNDDICQIRLDFVSFTITGPSTLTTSVTRRRPKSGEIIYQATGTVRLANAGQCTLDTFSVGNPSGPSPPTICGVNTGQHMYVEASKCCNPIVFKLGPGSGAETGVAAVTRSWSIKITQYSCNYNDLAPEGCVQYYSGSNTNQVQTFNYNGGTGLHLASQDQQVCVRRERGNCRICWSAIAAADFGTSGTIAGQNINNHVLCCSYAGPTANQVKGFDCVQIPGAQTNDATPVPRNSNLCGNMMGLPGQTTCSTACPFSLLFRSDLWEVTSPTAIASEARGGNAVNRGFNLIFWMNSIACDVAAIVGG